ncbi:MAG: SH3 domain-containing protein [Thermomicrobiales bacterium]|nr:SH3 domain-containing protein [Thermomicrobiales bacterium]
MPSSRTMSVAPVLSMQDLATFPVQQLGTAFTAGPWQLTLSNLVRGADAAAQIAAASDQNDAPADGIDYLLFQVDATNAGSESIWIDFDDFAVVGSSGIVRRSLELLPPEPILQGTVEPGQSISGLVPGAVEGDDAAPAILFDSRLLTGTWADAAIATAADGAFPSSAFQPVAVNEIGADPAAPAATNETIVTADWQIELLQAVFGQDVYELSDFRTQAVGDSDPSYIPLWAAVQVQVTNNRPGSAVSHLPVTAFSLSYSDGEEMLDVSRLTPPIPDISGDYLPGATRTGWAAFERPADFAGSVVRFQPYRTDADVRYLTWGDGTAPTNSQSTAAQSETTPVPPGETFASGTTVTTNEADVNLRAEPSTSADIVETIALGTTLTITGDPVEADGYTWYPVEDPATGNTGFMAANFLRVAG